MRYRILQTITADGVRLAGGSVVAATDVEPGCLQSMLRLGIATPEPPTTPPAPAPAAPAAPKPPTAPEPTRPKK